MARALSVELAETVADVAAGGVVGGIVLVLETSRASIAHVAASRGRRRGNSSLSQQLKTKVTSVIAYSKNNLCCYSKGLLHVSRMQTSKRMYTGTGTTEIILRQLEIFGIIDIVTTTKESVPSGAKPIH